MNSYSLYSTKQPIVLSIYNYTRKNLPACQQDVFALLGLPVVTSLEQVVIIL
jgi:hypothetical protein